ncbi:hypothetical protein H112_07506 [Trichophyton rubrum D6]|uniref:Uncharacterized protein n=1 Tax=Trichophyton rubrum CBS 288.86 TaxID=1215330 RepID=A0A022VSN7_TRIRU|nr:hypothetical protein H100_07532 [Trichophyton rubrum MR850]EZF38253.1 hypothetical protein H102_07496 [Trichophyton rubrum CBS 100081]EZF48959.1 hypothetical protein H103_07519 [Trichophyton rubrum CBS 288.86]EZF59607.1 hypothetical protein H104_07467 [Trichophyton rubrum CBS 289.86]EZF80842.1 hypothetical protein H110_07514 [Trichophyton rubrum MR1448]EZG13108.1 hypothetical protein H107_07684 [Trichophyton rubrum CBS 202.88]KDB30078.1 hypothetical protein H112_07506 [Trichophyton rubrum 
MAPCVVKGYSSQLSKGSSDNSVQGNVDTTANGKDEYQPAETSSVVATTASVASHQDAQQMPEQSVTIAEVVEPEDAPGDSTVDTQVSGSESSPIPVENFPLARTSLACFFGPTPPSTQKQKFQPPSRLSSSSPLSTCSLPVAPPPSPSSVCGRQYAAAAESLYPQLSVLPNPRPILPQMYPGSQFQGQYPNGNANSNSVSRGMPPAMAAMPSTAAGNVQYPQQGNFQRSIRPVPPPKSRRYLRPTWRIAYAFHPQVPIVSAPQPFTSACASSVPAPVPNASPMPIAPVSSPLKPKKSEYKGPLIVSSSPVRPPSQNQSSQPPFQQHVQQPFQHSVQQSAQQHLPQHVHYPVQRSAQYTAQQHAQHSAHWPVHQAAQQQRPSNSQAVMNNPGHGYGTYNNMATNGHNPRNINNVAVAHYHNPHYPQAPVSGPYHSPFPGNRFSNTHGFHNMNNTPTALPQAAQPFPIEDPFEIGTGPQPAPAGAVLKISNIPYNLLAREVMHFLGRRANLLPESRGTSIHVIMERSTAKTMDCYVELLTQADAEEALSWVNRNLPAHSPRLGDRHVHVEMSSQDALLREIFPRAKCVLWKNGIPEIQPNTDRYSTGFQGFLTNEELFCMVHYAEAPKRAPFAEKCPQRPYEFMISTLDKFPWASKSLYTVEHRNVLFDATRRQLQALLQQVNARRVIQLDERLLRDLLNAGLRCSTFNERQKYLLRVAAGQALGPVPRTVVFWPFDALTRRANAREESVEEYARLIRAAVLRRVPNLGELNNSWDAIQHGNSPFGPLMLEWRGEGARRSLQAAINTEIGVMKTLVSEGLAAVNTAA